jgi:hypothetical protein
MPTRPAAFLAMKALTQSAEFTKVLYPPGRSSEFSASATATIARTSGICLTPTRSTLVPELTFRPDGRY